MHHRMIIQMQNARIEQFLLPILLLERGEHQRTDTVGIQVDQIHRLLSLRGSLEDVRSHIIVLFYLLALLLCSLGLLDLQHC
jgi:hypothetical protein